MAMEVTTRDLLSLDIVITMDMDNLTFTRTVIIIMDLTDMRLSMITRRDLLRLDMAMVVIATSMSTGLTLTTRLRFIIHKHITMDMARGLQSLDMALLMSMLSRRIMDMVTQSLMNMDTTFIRDQLNQDMVITMDMDNLMSTRTAIIITDLMDMRLITIIRRDLLLLSLDMDMEDTAMSTEPLKVLLKDIMARDLLSQDMVTAPVSVITTEVPREFRDMAMEVTTRDLLSLDMVITMDMDNLMFTRTVIIIMDLTDMRLSMITRRDLLRLDMAMVVIATSMSTGLTLTTRLRFIIHKHITMDMARGLLSLDMALLMSMLSRRTMDMATQSLMNMDTTFIRDQLSQDMVMVMVMALLMSMLSRRTTDMVTPNLMNMDTTSIRDLLSLDMAPMKVIKKFPTLHTPIMISKCTTLTKQMA